MSEPARSTDVASDDLKYSRIARVAKSGTMLLCYDTSNHLTINFNAGTIGDADALADVMREGIRSFAARISRAPIEAVAGYRWRWNDSAEWSVTEYDPRIDASETRLARLGEVYPLYEHPASPAHPLPQGEAEPGRLDYPTDDSGALQPHDAWGGPEDEDPHENIHLYDDDSAFVVRGNGNKTLHGVQRPELLALFGEAGDTEELVERQRGLDPKKSIAVDREWLNGKLRRLDEITLQIVASECSLAAEKQLHEDAEHDRLTTWTVICERLGLEPTSDALAVVEAIERLKATSGASEQRVVELTAERDEALERVDELEREADNVSAEFERDVTAAMGRLLKRCHFDFGGDGWHAGDAEEYLLTTMDEIEKAEKRNLARANAAEASLAAAETQMRAMREALRLPDADRRLWFISDKIGRDGYFNRFDICAEFAVSVPQASIDIKRWMTAHPGAIEYNKSAKRYEHKLRAALAPVTTPPAETGG